MSYCLHSQSRTNKLKGAYAREGPMWSPPIHQLGVQFGLRHNDSTARVQARPQDWLRSLVPNPSTSPPESPSCNQSLSRVQPPGDRAKLLRPLGDRIDDGRND